MTSAFRAVVLAVAAAVFVFGGVTGFRLLTSSADTAEPAPTCTNKTVKKGEPLDSNLVTVNVFNASNRSGLANRVTINLQTDGFLGGTIGNSESATKPNRVAILTNDPRDPRVRLVARQFKDKVTYREPDITVEDGVIVIVGDNYSGLRSKAPTRITSDREITACVPTVLP
ncbi:LytR C-terminal domain-containing protein [Aeromicrobium sp. NPDC092404]|uniref:LytR C-terminal domain-containing protein n=1 Tax=Aeromicrobium sp. NPDC092404 TaxID=3154976 RepID=UPI00342B75B9